jgi:hypothetical protein
MECNNYNYINSNLDVTCKKDNKCYYYTYGDNNICVNKTDISSLADVRLSAYQNKISDTNIITIYIYIIIINNNNKNINNINTEITATLQISLVESIKRNIIIPTYGNPISTFNSTIPTPSPATYNQVIKFIIGDNVYNKYPSFIPGKLEFDISTVIKDTNNSSINKDNIKVYSLELKDIYGNTQLIIFDEFKNISDLNTKLNYNIIVDENNKHIVKNLYNTYEGLYKIEKHYL